MQGALTSGPDQTGFLGSFGSVTMLANIGVPLLARLEVLSLELDRILIGWDEDYLAARVARCFLIVPQPSRRPVAGYNLKSEQAFLRGELPAVAVNEVLWPAREIRHVLPGAPWRRPQVMPKEIWATSGIAISTGAAFVSTPLFPDLRPSFF
jgi:hypothetical protein